MNEGMNWEQMASEGWRFLWRGAILTGVFLVALVSTCTAGNQWSWSEWERGQRAACNASGGTWIQPLGNGYDKSCLRVETK